MVQNEEDSNHDINSFSSESKKKKISNSSVTGYQCEPEKKSGNLKKSKGENAKFFRRIRIAMIASIACLLCQYLIIGCNDMLGVYREKEKVNIEIPKGSSNSDVARILRENGVINESGFFLLYNFITRSLKNVVCGNFEINKDLDYEAIVNFLQSNGNRSKADVVEVTFREGLNILECAESLEKNGVCDAKDFLKACNSDVFDKDYEFLKSMPDTSKRYYRLEGYFFPDTYKFYKNSNVEDAVKKFLNNFEKKVYTKKKYKENSQSMSLDDMAKENNTNIHDVVILASLIQAEASNKEDMGVISSIFHNRLKTIGNGGKSSHGDFGMTRLESDPTVWYPYKNKESVPSNLVETFKSKYDTYAIEGLPPGPICNPGIDSLQAAISPEQTDYYFFCHNRDGIIFVAKTKSKHEENIKKAGIK
ncbi:MAG: endolytic transglycosylase MltG [Oscillospiraceae bacterium]|jgi:UPF0755 protein|nr:endolytic transglycosylase MltG [Oscillospiraceae bacterium]